MSTWIIEGRTHIHTYITVLQECCVLTFCLIPITRVKGTMFIYVHCKSLAFDPLTELGSEYTSRVMLDRSMSLNECSRSRSKVPSHKIIKGQTPQWFKCVVRKVTMVTCPKGHILKSSRKVHLTGSYGMIGTGMTWRDRWSRRGWGVLEATPWMTRGWSDNVERALASLKGIW